MTCYLDSKTKQPNEGEEGFQEGSLGASKHQASPAIAASQTYRRQEPTVVQVLMRNPMALAYMIDLISAGHFLSCTFIHTVHNQEGIGGCFPLFLFLVDLGVKVMRTEIDRRWRTAKDVVCLLQSFLAVTFSPPSTLSRALGPPQGLTLVTLYLPHV